MNVNLTYFKRTGKYYSEGSLQVPDSISIYEIWIIVKNLKIKKELPDLIVGHSDFIVLIKVPEHPYNHPKLIL